MATDAPAQPKSFWKKLLKQPLVPAGCLGTAGILIYGIYNFQIGNKEMSQKMMRWRVMSQFATLTVIGVSLGGYDFYERFIMSDEQREELKRQREIEFEQERRDAQRKAYD